MSLKRISEYDFNNCIFNAFALDTITSLSTDDIKNNNVQILNADDIILIDTKILLDFTVQNSIQSENSIKRNINDNKSFTFIFKHKILITGRGGGYL